MNWNRIEGNWKQATGALRRKWGALTDNDLAIINGDRDMLIGRIQERYGIAVEQAQKQVDDFARDFQTEMMAASNRLKKAMKEKPRVTHSYTAESESAKIN